MFNVKKAVNDLIARKNNQIKNMFMGLTVAASFVPSEASAQDKPVTDKLSYQTENIISAPAGESSSVSKELQPRIKAAAQKIQEAGFDFYLKMHEIGPHDLIPGAETAPGALACYDAQLHAVVVNQYTMTDEVALQRGQSRNRENLSPEFKGKSLQDILKAYNRLASKLKFSANAETLAEAEAHLKTLENSSESKNQKAYSALYQLSLKSGIFHALTELEKLNGSNKSNLAESVIDHELQHGKDDRLKNLVECGTIALAPRQVVIFRMAYEMKGWVAAGELDKFPGHYQSYLKKNMQDFIRGTSRFSSETYKMFYALSAEENYNPDKKILTPAESREMHLRYRVRGSDGKEYFCSRYFTDNGKYFANVVIDENSPRPVDFQGQVTDENGKSFETNILYDAKTGRAVKNYNGGKVAALFHFENGYWLKRGVITREEARNGYAVSENNFKDLMGRLLDQEKFREPILTMLKSLNVGKDLQNPLLEPPSSEEIAALRKECKETGYTLQDIQSASRQGIDNYRSSHTAPVGGNYIAVIKGGVALLEQDKTKPDTIVVKAAARARQVQK